MWYYLMKIYNEDYAPHHFGLEINLSAYCQGDKSIQEIYSRFISLWADCMELVYNNLASLPVWCKECVPAWWSQRRGIYIHLPQGFSSASNGDVVRLRRSLYGLKQAPCTWFKKFWKALLQLNFHQSSYDPSLYLHNTIVRIIVLLVYVDDIITSSTDITMIQHLQTSLYDSFHMKDLSPFNYFLGLEVHQSEKGLITNQHKYTIDLIEMASLQNFTQVDTHVKWMLN